MERPPILVVDDDDTLMNTIAEVLRDEGYVVATAANGQEALASVAQQAPAVIVLDMKMPIMDGWAFATAYHSQPGPHAPLVMMTAAYDAEQRAAEIQAQQFLVKPFTIEQLLELMQQLLPAWQG